MTREVLLDWYVETTMGERRRAKLPLIQNCARSGALSEALGLAEEKGWSNVIWEGDAKLAFPPFPTHGLAVVIAYASVAVEGQNDLLSPGIHWQWELNFPYNNS
ncbi:conserved hypothetical protein [Ricinus communis]|uniref:Uncharacterized protein n=1 Tax=Ricinus communis TaxID=3988 RepID=B9RQP2_RICCO|nr:conserved hypothetical protein [Ricinus communis]